MIAHIIVLLLLLIAVPDYYLHRHYLRRRRGYTWKWRFLWWLPALVMAVYALALTFSSDFAPTEIGYLYLFLLLLGLIVVPKVVFAMCSSVGLLVCRLTRSRRNWGNAIGLLLALLVVVGTIYGSTLGVTRLKVRHEEFVSKEIPEAFDGYRIVHFSDAHVGACTGYRSVILEKMVDSINAQHPDMVAFTGDIQNKLPSELDRVQPLLSKIQSRDGIFAVMGNHDYAKYIGGDPIECNLNEALTESKIRSLGWTLLINENRTVRRGNDSIFVVGTGDDYDSRYQPDRSKRSNFRKAMEGISDKSFALMLQHAPQLWPDSVLNHTTAQLTLSGHTHGGQVRILGFAPISLREDYWGGMYQEGHRALNVSTGVSGLIPFRIGMTPEIVVITLRRN